MINQKLREGKGRDLNKYGLKLMRDGYVLKLMKDKNS